MISASLIARHYQCRVARDSFVLPVDEGWILPSFALAASPAIAAITALLNRINAHCSSAPAEHLMPEIDGLLDDRENVLGWKSESALFQHRQGIEEKRFSKET